MRVGNFKRMKKIALILVVIALLAPLIIAATTGENLFFIFTDGTTMINATDVCVSTGECLINATNDGLTGNYTIGPCWMAYEGGIMFATNCTSI